MASFNKVILVGYLGKDPEIRYTPQGDAVCTFSVATTEKRKDRSGELQDSTTWFRVTAWRRQAELANQYLSKGRQVYVEGKLRQDEYTDRDGNKRTTLEITASEIHFLGPRGEEGTSAPAPAPAASRPAARQPDHAPPPPDQGDDEIPF